jgi:hypothetical protein
MALEAFLGLLHAKSELVFNDLTTSPFALYHFQQFARNLKDQELGLGGTVSIDQLLFRLGQLIEPIPKESGLSGTGDNVSGATRPFL